MRGRWGAIRTPIVGAALGLVLFGAPTHATAARPPGDGEVTRYSLAGGCYALRSQALGRLVAKSPDRGYRASARRVDAAEPFRMQATDLGRYFLYGAERDFLAISSGIGAPGRIEPANAPSESGDWTVWATGDRFTILSRAAGLALATSADGEVVLADPQSAGDAAHFSFEPARGCARYPEVEVNAQGRPLGAEPGYGEVRGFLDGHVHLMFFEAFGGNFHCGRPWHPFGVTGALPDCAEIEGPSGSAAPVHNFLNYGNPVHPHDTRGWPTFNDWPQHFRLTDEQIYYRWLERAWRGGLRLFVALNTDNAALCELLNPRRQHRCSEMDSVRRQIRDVYALQDYIDAQEGGPGRGWFRIVRNPFQARRVINRGKLAVVLGIETSELFDCRLRFGASTCDRDDVDRGLDEVHDLGVRQMELLNKFDSPFGGVIGDGGTTGVIVNTGNFWRTGRWWDLETCTGEHHDLEQLTAEPHTDLGIAFAPLLPPGAAPVYPEPPHCNTLGLTSLGQHLVRGMMRREMLVDPDHLGVLAESQALALAEAKDYSGVISSHSWSDEFVYPRVYRLGGVTTPYAGNSTTFAEAWRERRKLRRKRFFFGFGYGSDVHGLAGQGDPREASIEAPPVRYPFKSFDGAVTLARQRSGERVFDINTDGVAHYGLYADWIEDLRMVAGDRIVRDMARGAEAYLQTWERAVGVPRPRCRSPRVYLRPGGAGLVRLGSRPERLLRRAGQPERRSRAWRYCVRGAENRNAKVVAVFTPDARVGLVLTTARGHTAGGIGRGDSATRIEGDALGRGLRVHRTGDRGARFIYRVRDRRVRFVAVASRWVASNERRLRRHLELAAVR